MKSVNSCKNGIDQATLLAEQKDKNEIFEDKEK